MLLPTALVVLVLLIAIVGGIYVAKKRVVDHEHTPDIRPNDRRPTAHVDVSS